MKTIYDRLQPGIKSQLQESSRNYTSAKRLKYKLMSTTLWYDLSLDDISSLMSYAGLYTSDVTASDVIYGGEKFITK